MRLFIKPEEEVQEFYKNHTSAYKGDCGIDLFFPKDVTVPGRSTKLIDLGISCEMISVDYRRQSIIENKPVETYKGDNTSYYLYPRSSIIKTPLIMHNSVGIIDSKYRNNIKVAVYNTSDDEYTVKRGERLFQICSPGLEEIHLQLTDELSSSTRGEGFGSSGK